MKTFKKGDLVELELTDWNMARFETSPEGKIIGRVFKNKGDNSCTAVKDAVDVQLTKKSGRGGIFAIERSELT
jgi:hypothetical protein